MKVGQEDFVSKLKSKLKGELVPLKGGSHHGKLSLLVGLARIKKEEEGKINLKDQATLLYNTWKNINEEKPKIKSI